MRERKGAGLLLGIDIGGTHTRAALAAPHGDPIARATGPAGNPVRVGPKAALRAIHGVVNDVLSGQGNVTVLACAVGMSGISHPAARGILRAAFLGRALPARRIVRDDVSAALDAAFPDGGDGVLLLAGTGSGAVARRGGVTVRVGGFGPLLGDDGSGHAIVIEAARSVVRAAQGFGPKTTLSARFSDALGGADPSRLGAALATHPDVASLFPLVAEEAAAADPVAVAVLRKAAADLAALARAVTELAGLTEARIATAGGAFSGSRHLRDAFGESVRDGLAVVDDPIHVEDALPGTLAWAKAACEQAAPCEF